MYNENQTAAPKNTAAVTAAAAAYRIEGLLYQSVNAKKVLKTFEALLPKKHNVDGDLIWRSTRS